MRHRNDAIAIATLALQFATFPALPGCRTEGTDPQQTIPKAQLNGKSGAATGPEASSAPDLEQHSHTEGKLTNAERALLFSTLLHGKNFVEAGDKYGQARLARVPAGFDLSYVKQVPYGASPTGTVTETKTTIYSSTGEVIDGCHSRWFEGMEETDYLPHFQRGCAPEQRCLDLLQKGTTKKEPDSK